jgi:hypothetical protein
VKYQGWPLTRWTVDTDSLATSSQPSLTSADTPPTAALLSDPERWVEEYGDYLFKFALVRLRDQTKAEDMVQETFLAALKGGEVAHHILELLLQFRRFLDSDRRRGRSNSVIRQFYIRLCC